jgi:hypothetical protein
MYRFDEILCQEKSLRQRIFFVQKEVSWMRACEDKRHAMNPSDVQKHRIGPLTAPSDARNSAPHPRGALRSTNINTRRYAQRFVSAAYPLNLDCQQLCDAQSHSTRLLGAEEFQSMQ